MKQYTVNGLSASGTANKTAVNIIGSATIRPMICGLVFGVRTNPNSTDQQLQIQVGNTTAVGTAGSAATPKPNDPADVAAVSTAGITHSAEPTYGSSYFLDFDMNQRSLFRWVAEPGYELVGAATASNGVAAKLTAVTAALVISVVTSFRE